MERDEKKVRSLMELMVNQVMEKEIRRAKRNEKNKVRRDFTDLGKGNFSQK